MGFWGASRLCHLEERITSEMPAITPPPRQQQRHPQLIVDQAPLSPSYPRAVPSQAPASPVQTPTKTSAGADVGTSAVESLGQKHPWGMEVKNTFIHYGSPVKTVSVATPPKTVPSYFAPPEVLKRDFARAPILPMPSAQAGVQLAGATAPALSTEARHTQVAGSQASVAGTLLRLSDYLPSPAAVLPLQSQAIPGHCDPAVMNAAMPGWPACYEGVPGMMPPVPPLPVPNFPGVAGMPGMSGFEVPPPVPPPPQHSPLNFQPMQDCSQVPAMVHGACGVMPPPGSAPPAPMHFDNAMQQQQFVHPGGDATLCSSGPSGQMTYAPMMMPEQHLHLPMQPPDAEALHYPGSHPAPSGHLQVPAGDHGLAPRVSISVGHFPEPGGGVPTVTPALPPQPAQM